MPGRVNMIRKDGTVKSVPAEKVEVFKSLGYILETPDLAQERRQEAQQADYYSGTTQGLKAFGEGVVDGLGAGMGEVIFDSDASAARKKYHGGVRGAGELVGAVLPFVTPTGAASKALALTPTGLLGRGAAAAGTKLGGKGVAGIAAGAAVEGAVYGLGTELGDAHLSGDPLTVEGVVASSGLGLLTGAAAGGVAGGLMKLGGAARHALTIEDDISQSILKTNPGPQPSGRALPVKAERVAKWHGDNPFADAVDEGAVKLSVSEGILPDIKYQDLRKTVDEVSKSVTAVTAELEHQHKLANALKSPDRLRSHLERVGNDIYERGMTDPELAGVAKKELSSLRANYGHLQKAVKSGDPVKIEARLEAYRESIKAAANATGGNAILPGNLKALQEKTTQAAELQYALSNLNLPSTSDDLFAIGKHRAEELFARVEAVLSNKLPEGQAIRDQLAAVVEDIASTSGISKEAAGGPVGKLRGAWEVGKQSREMAAQSYRSAKEGAKLEYAVGEAKFGPAQKYKKTPDDYLDADYSKPTPGTVEAATPPKARKKGAKGLMGRAKDILARSAVYKGLNAVAPGLSWVAKSQLTSVLLAAKAGITTKVTQAATNLATVGRVVKPLAGKYHPLAHTVDGILDDPNQDTREMFAARSEELRRLASSIQDTAAMGAMELEGAGLGGEFAKGDHETVVRAVTELANRIPASPPGTNWGTEYMWEASEEQILQFSQEYQAVTQPGDFIEVMGNDPASVFPESVELFATAYPTLYADFRAQALANFSSVDPTKATREYLEELSTILKAPLVPTMDPAFIADQMGMFMQPPEPQGPDKKNSGPVGRPPGALADATASQRQDNR
jgi:hypothetical protein